MGIDVKPYINHLKPLIDSEQQLIYYRIANFCKNQEKPNSSKFGQRTTQIANYLVTGEVPSEWKTQDMKHFFAKIHAYY